MLKVTVAASHGSGEINEDVVGFCGSAVWVIDGATGVGASLLEAPSDAAWLARRADRELHAALSSEPDLPTVDLLRRVMSACRESLETERVRMANGAHEHPSAAFAMVRHHAGRVEFSTLGNCRIVYRHEGTVRLFGTTPLAEIERRTIELARQCMDEDPTITPAMLRDKLLPQLRANRSLMNRPDGYWVLGIEPAAADHLDRLTVPACDGDAFALASDGFLRLIEVFEVASPADLLAMDNDDAFAAALDKLRALENLEGSCHRHPRVKVHDDATFAHCRIVEES